MSSCPVDLVGDSVDLQSSRLLPYPDAESDLVQVQACWRVVVMMAMA